MLELFFELLTEVVGQILLELGTSSLKEAAGRQNHHPILATFGYLILGVMVGSLLVFFFPERVFHDGPVSGISLLIAFLVGGGVMHTWGWFRRSRGHEPTNLASFYGGGTFAFAVALVRFLFGK